MIQDFQQAKGRGMDVQKQIEYWREGAEEELEVAGDLLEKKRYRHALLFCHLALEKMIKAHVARATLDFPPKIHNLIKLAQIARLDLPPDKMDYLRTINPFQLIGRYPDEIAREIPAVDALRDYYTAKEMLQWLKAQL